MAKENKAGHRKNEITVGCYACESAKHDPHEFVACHFLLLGFLILEPKQQPESPPSESESKLRDEILELTEELNKIRQELHMINQQNDEFRQELHMINQQNAAELSKLRKLETSFPELKTQMAFISIASPEDSYQIQLDYVEWLVGDEAIEASDGGAPNGFFVRNDTEEKVARVIDKDTHFYLVDDNGHRFVEVDEFMDYIRDPAYKLFRVYEINENILLIEEQYLP